ncbi:MAG: hypothetical protein IPK60_09440 [Sandaracinaceae bacterium]|nr:hypothetical protein [Sandaracinaceae bacterium]
MERREAHHGDALYVALDELRGGSDRHSRTHDLAWRVVFQFVGTIRPLDEDAQQETLLRISRAIASFAGQTAGEAVRWVKTVHTRKHIDQVRKSARDPVAQNLDRARGDDETQPSVELLSAAPEAPSVAALNAFADELFVRVDEELMRTIPRDSARRHLRRTWARAAFLRLVYELDSDAIVRELALTEPPSKDLISKWVERGRAVIRDTLDAWPDDDDRSLVIETLRALMDERRADAGKARNSRRKGEAKDDGNA